MVQCRGNGLLQSCIINDDINQLVNLLKQGADVNYVNDTGETALFVASFYGLDKFVNTLIQATLDGNSPLHAAAYKFHDKIINKLLDSGADLKAMNKRGQTAVDLVKKLKNSIKNKANGKAVSSNNNINNNSNNNKQNLKSSSQVYDSLNSSKYISQNDSCLRYLATIPIITKDEIIEESPIEIFDNQAFCELKNIVWRGVKVCLRRLQVKKLIKSSLPTGKTKLLNLMRSQIVRDLKWISNLRHPNIMSVLGVLPQCTRLQTNIEFDLVSLALERPHLGSMFHFLHTKLNKFPLLSIFQIAKQISEALLFLHKSDIIHCNVTSHSIYLLSIDTAKLGNFEHAIVESKNANEYSQSCYAVVYAAKLPINSLGRWLPPELLLQSAGKLGCHLMTQEISDIRGKLDIGNPKISSDVFMLCRCIQEMFNPMEFLFNPSTFEGLIEQSLKIDSTSKTSFIHGKSENQLYIPPSIELAVNNGLKRIPQERINLLRLSEYLNQSFLLEKDLVSKNPCQFCMSSIRAGNNKLKPIDSTLTNGVNANNSAVLSHQNLRVRQKTQMEHNRSQYMNQIQIVKNNITATTTINGQGMPNERKAKTRFGEEDSDGLLWDYSHIRPGNNNDMTVIDGVDRSEAILDEDPDQQTMLKSLKGLNSENGANSLSRNKNMDEEPQEESSMENISGDSQPCPSPAEPDRSGKVLGRSPDNDRMHQKSREGYEINQTSAVKNMNEDDEDQVIKPRQVNDKRSYAVITSESCHEGQEDDDDSGSGEDGPMNEHQEVGEKNCNYHNQTVSTKPALANGQKASDNNKNSVPSSAAVGNQGSVVVNGMLKNENLHEVPANQVNSSSFGPFVTSIPLPPFFYCDNSKINSNNIDNNNSYLNGHLSIRNEAFSSIDMTKKNTNQLEYIPNSHDRHLQHHQDNANELNKNSARVIYMSGDKLDDENNNSILPEHHSESGIHTNGVDQNGQPGKKDYTSSNIVHFHANYEIEQVPGSTSMTQIQSSPPTTKRHESAINSLTNNNEKSNRSKHLPDDEEIERNDTNGIIYEERLNSEHTSVESIKTQVQKNLYHNNNLSEIISPNSEEIFKGPEERRMKPASHQVGLPLSYHRPHSSVGYDHQVISNKSERLERNLPIVEKNFQTGSGLVSKSMDNIGSSNDLHFYEGINDIGMKSRRSKMSRLPSQRRSLSCENSEQKKNQLWQMIDGKWYRSHHRGPGYSKRGVHYDTYPCPHHNPQVMKDHIINQQQSSQHHDSTHSNDTKYLANSSIYPNNVISLFCQSATSDRTAIHDYNCPKSRRNTAASVPSIFNPNAKEVGTDINDELINKKPVSELIEVFEAIRNPILIHRLRSVSAAKRFESPIHGSNLSLNNNSQTKVIRCFQNELTDKAIQAVNDEKNDSDIAAGKYFLGRFIRPVSQTEITQSNQILSPNQALSNSINTPTIANLNYSAVQANPVPSTPQNGLVTPKPFQSNQIFTNSTQNGSSYNDHPITHGINSSQDNINQPQQLPTNQLDSASMANLGGNNLVTPTNSNMMNKMSTSNNHMTPPTRNSAAIGLAELSNGGKTNILNNLDNFAKNFKSPSSHDMSRGPNNSSDNNNPINNGYNMNTFTGQNNPDQAHHQKHHLLNSIPTPTNNPMMMNTQNNNPATINNNNNSKMLSDQSLPLQTIIQQELSSLRPNPVMSNNSSSSANNNTSKPANIEDSLFQLANNLKAVNNMNFNNPLGTSQYNQMNPMYTSMTNNHQPQVGHQSRSDLFYNPQHLMENKNNHNQQIMSNSIHDGPNHAGGRIRSSSWQPNHHPSPSNNNNRNRPVWFQGPLTSGQNRFNNVHMNNNTGNNNLQDIYNGDNGIEMSPGSAGIRSMANVPTASPSAPGVGGSNVNNVSQAFYNSFQPHLNNNIPSNHSNNSNSNNNCNNRWEQLKGLKFTPILNHKKAPFKSF